MIVITGATGNIGSQVLANVLKSSEPVRVVVRDISKLFADVRDRVEVVEGSHTDLAVVTQAFSEADSLFWLPPGDPIASSAHAAYMDFSRAAVQVLKGSGIKRVVAVSALGRGRPKEAGM